MVRMGDPSRCAPSYFHKITTKEYKGFLNYLLMGIDFTGLEALLFAHHNVKNKQNCLTLGRQQLHRNTDLIHALLNKWHFSELTKNNYQCNEFCEKLLTDLGYNIVDSIDNSNYENATIIHNLNNPIPSNFKKYDFIFDGGTTEHIFNTAQVCENIINLLEIDGIYCSVVPNNNFSGHGIYQFSPEFFLSAYSKEYGMEIVALYIAKNDSQIHEWINVNYYDEKNIGRTQDSFNSLDEVYVIVVAKKISNDRLSLITNSPNQYSYKKYFW